MQEISIKDKAFLTLDEASAFSSIGVNKIRELTKQSDCDFVLYVGTKRLIKKDLFQKYLNEAYSI